MANTQKTIEIKIPIKNVPVKYWGKIEVGKDWDKEYQTNTSNKLPMMINADELEEKPYNNSKYWDNNACDKSFKNEEILNGFKKYTNGDKIFFKYRHGGWADFGREQKEPLIKDVKISDWFYVENPSQLTKYLRDANKLFVKDGYGKLTSQEGLEFLKTIVNSEEIEATLKLTHNEFNKFFELEKQNNDLNQKLTNQQIISKDSQRKVIELEKSILRLEVEKELLENKLTETSEQKTQENIITGEFEQLPFVCQVEALAYVNWLGETGIKNPYSYQTIEQALKQQALRIWNEKTFDENEVLKMLTENNTRKGDVKHVLERILLYKNTSSFGTDMDARYRWNAIGIMNDIYQKQLKINENKEIHIVKLGEEIEELASELLEIKRTELNKIVNDYKSKLDENLHDYLEILLEIPEKNSISDKAKRNLITKLNGNDLQKLILLQHEINKLEKIISDNQYQTQIEISPPSYKLN